MFALNQGSDSEKLRDPLFAPKCKHAKTHVLSFDATNALIKKGEIFKPSSSHRILSRLERCDGPFTALGTVVNQSS